MDPFTIGILGIIALLVLLALGLHIAVTLALVGMGGMVLIIGPEAAIYTSATLSYARMNDYLMVIVPLYVMMGFLAQETGASAGAYECLRSWTGRLRGGLGVATVGGCTLFGTLCGSSLVTAAVFAQISAPEMRRTGYHKQLAYGVCSSGGLIGMLIPPSILMVVYGLMTEESVGRLLIAGISPGLGVFVFFSLGIILMAYLRPKLVPKAAQKYTWREKFVSLKYIWQVVLATAIIVIGIFTGIFSPSEAGAIACVIFLIIYVISKARSWTGLKSALLRTVSTSAMIFLILIGAGIFSRFLVLSTIGPRFLEAVVAMKLSPMLFLIGAAVIYIILGCFFDSISMLGITLPFLHPAALKLGIDPLHFAMVAILAIEMGVITPPVGLNIFAVKAVAESDVTLEDLYAGVWPFTVIMFVVIIIYVIFPALSTWLPTMMMG